MKSVAIIGTGIAGMACGHFLHPRYDLTLYERNAYVGGHTHTLLADEDGRAIPIDTGFMVYNEVTYPNLTRLFRELDVQTKPTEMSFSVQHLPTGLEFCGSGLNGLFAQRKNLFSLHFWNLLRQIGRFNRESPRILDDPHFESYTLRRYAQEKGYTKDFLDQYLIPMSSAVWSTEPDAMLNFPAVTLVRFFKNHGFLGLHTQHPWRTVAGGSRMYRDKIIQPFRERIRVQQPAVRVARREGKAWVTDSKETRPYDLVILASHANESLALLQDPTARERELLGAFSYQTNTILLHTDAAVMPKTRAAWSSWNYRTEKASDGPARSSTIYWMNSLQKVSEKQNYFVSVNDPHNVDSDRILQRIAYDHPVFSVEATAAQKQLCNLNDNGITYFCGSYFKYGFHEDALNSALDVVQRLGVRPWA
jgi:predicted NAD/FAD-binding protein